MKKMCYSNLDSSWSRGQGDQSSSSFVAHGIGRGVKEVVNAFDEAGSLLWVRNAHFVDKFHNDQLQDFIEGMNLIDTGTQVVQGSFLKRV